MLYDVKAYWVKKILLCISVMCLFTGSASAQVVNVDGYGIDRSTALRDAERNAVETIAGTYIDSRTLVSNSMTELDEILSKTTGFVHGSKVVKEGAYGDSYMVNADVDVDTSPNAALISRLSTIMRLNDPRIAVVVLNGTQHDAVIENALNARLIEMGFSHVIDSKIVSSLYSAPSLEQLYSGYNIVGARDKLGADFVVFGKLVTEEKNIVIPDFKGGDIDTKLVTGRAVMYAKIIRLSTGEIIENFVVDSKGIQLDNKSASSKAVLELSTKAAAKMEEKFKKISAKATTAYQIVAYTENYNKITQLVADIHNMSGIGNVFIREYSGNKALIELDSIQTIETVVRILRERSKLRLFVESINNGSASIIVN